jgi:hypothetical protein
MADEAFALSPISARAALPSEADYDAIREAFMETARGRWFLGEYGKRNRNADTSMVLDAVARIEATIVAAQKPAPVNELPDALVLIRGLLSDAKASAARTMSGPDAELALAAVNKAARIIREIAWTLREYGTDTRICDMLDAQVNAIETGHQHTIASEKRDAVLATFDLLIRRIGELGGSAEAASSPDFETDWSASSPAGNEAATATAETEAAATASSEAAPEAVAQAAVELAATPDVIDTTAQDALDQDALALEATTRDATVEATTAQDTLAQDTLAQGTLAQGTLAQDTQAQDTQAQDTQAQGTIAQDRAAQETTALEAPAAIPRSSEGSAAAMMTASAEVAATASSERETVAAANAEAAALDLEIAQDMAILDAIALEMAEPDFVGSDRADTQLAESDLAVPPQVIEAETGERGMVESASVEPVAAEPATAIPDSVALASEIFVAPKPQPEEPSLGATLIASGILSNRSAANDALAPFKRMTQAERVAFFS